MQRFLRPIWVVSLLLPYLASFWRDWRRWFLFGTGVERTEADHAARARGLRETLARLGPTFIKAAQVAGMREDVFPRVYTAELRSLQDRVPPFPAARARRTIEEALGRRINQLFDSFDDEPLAAASLGQVHRAVYKGQPVAVKVLRPGVEQLVAIDMAVVSAILRFIRFFLDNYFMRGLATIWTEYRRMIVCEMDFRNEQANADRFRRNFADDPRVIVPRCREELTTTRTVVFDFADGVRPDDAAGLRRMGVDVNQLMLLLIETYVRMTVRHGFVHADPHPGNLLVDGKGRVVILDYGMALELPDDIRLELLRGCYAVVRNDTERLVEAYYNLGMVDPEINRSLVRQAAETMIELQLRDDFTMRKVQDIADDILATFHKFPLRMPEQLVYLVRASALIEGLGFSHDEHFSSLREAIPVIKKLIAEVALEPEKPILDRLRTWGEDAVETLVYLRRLVVRFEREEQRVRVHQGDLRRLEGNIAAATRRVVAAIACLAVLVGGAVVFAKTGSWVVMVSAGAVGFSGLAVLLIAPFSRE